MKKNARVASRVPRVRHGTTAVLVVAKDGIVSVLLERRHGPPDGSTSGRREGFFSLSLSLLVRSIGGARPRVAVHGRVRVVKEGHVEGRGGSSEDGQRSDCLRLRRGSNETGGTTEPDDGETERGRSVLQFDGSGRRGERGI